MDAEQFRKLFMPFHEKLYRIAFALLGNSNDAEDMLQDAYYKLWCKRDELTALDNPESFAVTVLKNICLDFLRSPKMNRNDEMIDDEYSLAGGRSPDEELDTKEQLEQVKRIIRKLPDKQRQLIQLSCIEGCSVEQMEHITGLNAINIRVLISRTRKEIREKLKKLYNYER